MSAKHSVKVSILNEEYTLRSDAPPELARAVAQYLDQAVRQIMSSGAVVESSRAVVLAALRVTAELFEEREALQSIRQRAQQLSAEVRPLLPPAKRG